MKIWFKFWTGCVFGVLPRATPIIRVALLWVHHVTDPFAHHFAGLKVNDAQPPASDPVLAIFLCRQIVPGIPIPASQCVGLNEGYWFDQLVDDVASVSTQADFLPCAGYFMA